MDILWLIGISLSVDLLCGTSLAHISVLPISKDNGHGTQYRFQYYVRDERGDYKTQEEAGEGGKARGSYAVEEPDGDLRIVQYTADLGGGFKAHIKVDHAGKPSSKLQEIDIPAEEMQKLIESNRRKTVQGEEKEDDSSKSYVLGPPRKMSEIVMEQAAAIREIISKEIEAEEKREAEEKVIDESKKRGEEAEIKTVDEVDCDEKKAEIDSQRPHNSGESLKIEGKNDEKIFSESRKPKLMKIEAKESVESLKDSQVLKKDLEATRIEDSTTAETQSPVVRVALTPRKIEDIEKPTKKQIQLPASDGPVQNFSFKNRIVFYKPVENRQRQNEPGIESARDLKVKNGNSEEISDREEIVLYSPYQEGEGKEGDRNSRFITVPYEVLRPYLTQMKKDEEKNK